MAQTVIGIFNNANEAENAKQQLLNNGYAESNVDIADGRTADYSNRSTEHEHESGIARFFRNLFGGDEEERERYTRVAERGYVVTVYADSKDDAERAADLLDDYGAVDVDENYKRYKDDDYTGGNVTNSATDVGLGLGTGMGYSGTDTRLADTHLQSDNDSDNDRILAREKNDRNLFDNDRNLFDRDRKQDDVEGKTIPVIEEDIKVGKRAVETGGVRIKSRIIEKPVEETLRLRTEHVRVERNRVDREATSDDLDNFKEETIELRETTEEPVVEKRARVVEEVSLNKDVDHHEENVNDTVRNTTVDVEKLEGSNRR
jgi:uncharacterized protein (TIGR02271 family)